MNLLEHFRVVIGCSRGKVSA